MKTGLGVPAVGLAAGIMFWGAIGESAERAAKAKADVPAKAASPPKGQPAAGENMPEIIPDESADDWVVDRFAGNSTAGAEFFPGSAREVGGLGRCGVW